MPSSRRSRIPRPAPEDFPELDALAHYDYELPERLIAHTPAARRDEARLLVVRRNTGSLEHRTVRDLPHLLRPGDSLVLNDTRVIPARLFGRRTATGGKWEGLFLGVNGSGQWRLLGRAGGRLKPGEQITLIPASDPPSDRRFHLRLVASDDEGIWTADPGRPDDPLEILDEFGAVPLPPYIDRTVPDPADRERYQTVYASRPGAVAAPTAGLHFTDELLAEFRKRGIDQIRVTLHVGIGTFRPISAERLSDHRMHSEWCELTPAAAQALLQTRARGGRIVAVGTTSARTLETAARSGELRPFRGETDLFIRPPYEFRAVDALVTNFHLPKSSLYVLVCALAGWHLMRTAYEAAIANEYRFYSYGDAMLILEV